jgi:ubiquinone/menaquinone biosynthesis C-methylase UbiE
MPGGIEMTFEAENYLSILPGDEWLSVACGTGELELYLADKYGCAITGIDIGEWAIAKARDKTAARDLGRLARFEIGDGNSLRFGAAAFDGVFCSGALCAFYEAGLTEFRRVLKPAGVAVVLDVVWRREPVPLDVAQRWAGGTAEIHTLDGNVRAFQGRGFGVLYARAYHEPSWWAAYYDDRGDASHWQEERNNYLADQAYVGVGLFVLEKAAQ